MAYLTYVEYEDLSLEPLTEPEFDKLLKPSTVKLDTLTNYFYTRHDLETDFTARKQAFKTALAYQIDYYNYQGGINSYDGGDSGNYSSITIGRTTVSNGSSVDNAYSGYYGSPRETLDLLNMWGFLYRGVGTYQG